MCTRYYYDNSNPDLREIANRVESLPLTQEMVSNFGIPVITNGEVHPSELAPVIAPNKNGQMCFFAMKWGFNIPALNPASTEPKNLLYINARSETAREKKNFKESWELRRCIVPASYYFEWKHIKDPNNKTVKKDKYLIQPQNMDITYLAGLYRIENNYPVFTVLTMPPSEEIAKIHDRMPVIFPKDQIENWINPKADPNELLQFALTDMYTEKVSSG